MYVLNRKLKVGFLVIVNHDEVARFVLSIHFQFENFDSKIFGNKHLLNIRRCLIAKPISIELSHDSWNLLANL